MRKLAIGLLAAAGIALAGSASAQGFYVGAGPGGVGVGVGVGPGYYGHSYYDDDYRWGSGYRAYAYEGGPGYARCRTTLVRNSWGELRRVRRCW
jgi:hypothetical protein